MLFREMQMMHELKQQMEQTWMQAMNREQGQRRRHWKQIASWMLRRLMLHGHLYHIVYHALHLQLRPIPIVYQVVYHIPLYNPHNTVALARPAQRKHKGDW